MKRRLRESILTRAAYRNAGVLLTYAGRLQDRIRYGRSFPVSYFDEAFARRADPWSYEGDGVSEQRKTLLLALISERPTSRVLEIGCASGWMTADLGSIAHAVTAIDISPTALSLARERCSGIKNVIFQCCDILTEEMPGTYETVLCAGVLVYLPWSAQSLVRDRIVDAIEPEGILILEHTRQAVVGEVAGERIHDLYCKHPAMTLLAKEQRDIYEVLVLERSHEMDRTQDHRLQ